MIVLQIEEIFAGLATNNAVPSSASSSPRHSNSSSHLQPLTRSQPLSPHLQQQQEEAMAELHAALSTVLKPSSSSAQRLTVAAENSEQHDKKQQLLRNHQQQQSQSRLQHPQNPEEATATHVQPTALTIQQQQEQALAELQALMQSQHVSSSVINTSSSSLFSGASVSHNPQPRSSSDAALVSTPESSHRAHDPASPRQLQRAPPAPSDDDSDPEFSQFLNEFDNLNS
jgi:leucyl aminopeptidase